MQTSVREIRFRLLTLLFRAFITVLILLLIFFLSITGYILTFRPDFAAFRFPFVNSLEGYYLGHGSWDGVENVLALNNEFNSASFLLVDENNRIILNRLPDSATKPGSIYDPVSNDVVFDLVSVSF